jgi:dienelactone hydrolase
MPSAQPPAAVLLIGGSGGSEPAYLGEAFAAEGIAALSVAYFARPGLPAQLRGIPLEYFFAALELLRAEVRSPDVPLAILGMSRGSEAAMLTAIHSAIGSDGVLATVPGNVIAGSLPAGGPAWLLDGEPLPYATHSGPDCADPLAVIPVERVPGQVFLVAAGDDRVWPSAAMANALADRLRERGHRYGRTVLVYPKAGHSVGYLTPELPAGLLPAELSDGPEERAARADAWPKAVEFLRQLSSRAAAVPAAGHDCQSGRNLR